LKKDEWLIKREEEGGKEEKMRVIKWGERKGLESQEEEERG
jgi:hypothetical protein